MENELNKKIDQIIELLQALFILESSKSGFTREDVRKILRIKNAKVSRIAKHLKFNK